MSSGYQDLMGHLILAASSWSVLTWITLLCIVLSVFTLPTATPCMVRERLQTMLTRFCPLSTTYPSTHPLVDICEGIPLLLLIRENIHTIDITNTTYLPCLINVVCERPPIVKKDIKCQTIRASFTRCFYLLFLIL